ncbi:unnamed protein product [Cunninghamella blakesleeana]
MALNRFINEAFHNANRNSLSFDQPFFEPPSNQLERRTRYPPTDILETDNGYEIHAEVPGVEKQNLDIQVLDDHTIVLKGGMKYSKTESSPEPTEANADTSESASPLAPHWWRSERMSGSFSRSYSFPQSINANDIKANYQDGILTIAAPKSKKAFHRITID